jgi:hypothetical protein
MENMGPLDFVVLIPHRDSVPFMRAYSRTLFAAGLAGAFSFPPAAPLALVSRPFTRGELKALALALRELSLRDGREGKIRTGAAAALPCPLEDACGEFAFWGLTLDLPLGALSFPAGGEKKIRRRFSGPILCAAIIGPGDKGRAPSYEGPPVSFRAAAVANMRLRPLAQGEAAYSYEWETGLPAWLAGYKKKKES